MSSTQTDSDKYFRASVAMPIARKPIYEARLAELGLKTTGELISMFTIADGVVEALKPLLPAFHAKLNETNAAAQSRRKKALDVLTGLDPAELDRLVELAKKATD